MKILEMLYLIQKASMTKLLSDRSKILRGKKVKVVSTLKTISWYKMLNPYS